MSHAQHRCNHALESGWTVKNAVRILVANLEQPVSAYGIEHAILARWPQRQKQIAGTGRVCAALHALASAGELRRDHKTVPSVFTPTQKLRTAPSL